MRKLALKLLFFLPILLVIAAVNYRVDPVNLYHPKYVLGIVDLLLKGNDVANITNCRERTLQKSFLEKDGARRDILFLGSSRTLEVHSDSFPQKSFYNASVPAATVEDYMALYEILRRKNALPSILIVEWEPWTLRNNKKMMPKWKELEPYYSLSANRLSVEETGKTVDALSWQTYGELISPSYFKESLKRFLAGRQDDYFPISSPVIDDRDVTIRHIDGSLTYNKKYRLTPYQEVLSQVRRLDPSRMALSLLGSFEDINTDQKAKIETFVDGVLDDKVNIYFLLLPYHPFVYRHFRQSDEYRIVFQTEVYFQEMAARKDIPLLGSFNPDQVDVRERDFYDEMHVRGEVMAGLIGKFWQR